MIKINNNNFSNIDFLYSVLNELKNQYRNEKINDFNFLESWNSINDEIDKLEELEN